MTHYVIFEIDNDDDIHVQAKFLRHIDTLRSMGKLRDADLFRTMIGSWKGDLAVSYRMGLGDYMSHVYPHGWTNGQDCILLVRDTAAALMRKPTKKGYQHSFENIGRLLKSPTQPDADGWTYDPVEKRYAYTEAA